MNLTTFLLQFVVVLILAIAGTGLSFLWRTSIYTRGAIFRPIGRILDLWVHRGNLSFTGFGYKILRFIAYPLGRCIYCSSVHITYDVFFLANYVFELHLNYWWLLIMIPIVHLFVISFCRLYIHSNTDMDKGDWSYMNEIEPNRLIDYRKRSKMKSVLDEEDERKLSIAKGDITS